MSMSRVLAVAACVVTAACSGDAAPKVPLGEAAPAASEAQTGSVANPLPPAAMGLLEAGNNAYRAKQFDVAIAKYREAAAAAPKHAAPWFGVFMAASASGNTALADSASARVQMLSADTSALTAHTDAASGAALPPGHPTAGAKLPPGHPDPKAQLPPGHPAPTKKP
jgi:hypothetical protein